MTIVEITEDNVEEFKAYMGEDMAENLGREFYHGLAAMSDTEDSFLAGIVWEYLNLEGELDTESRIEWLKVKNPEAEEALFQAYKDAIRTVKAVRSSVVIQADDSENEKEALKNAGFKVKLTEGDYIIVSLSEFSNLHFYEKQESA